MNPPTTNTRPLLGIIHFFLDAIIISLCLVSVIKFYEIPWNENWQIFLIFSLMLHIIIFGLQSYYIKSRYENLSLSIGRMTIAWSLLVVGMLTLGFFTKSTDTYSRFVILFWSLITPFLMALSLCLARCIKKRNERIDANKNNTLIIGTDNHAHNLYKKLCESQKSETCSGLVSVDNNPLIVKDSIRNLGNIEHIRQIVSGNRICKIYIALGLKYSEKVEEIQFALLDLNVDVIWAPDIHNFNLINHSIQSFQGLPMIAINQSPLNSSETAALAKSILDKSIALISIIVFSPLLAFIALAVKLSSDGPILFIQDRTGFDGEIIKVFKFRSMKVHSEQGGQITQAKLNDSRITKVGAFLRKTSLDELPQLFNVIRGEMSLVGPRPHAVEHNEFYSKKINSYLARHRMKPGITGLAQVKGFRGETDTDEKMEKRVKYDLEYINNWSVWMDIKILCKTPISLITHQAF